MKMWLCALLIAGCALDKATQDDRPATFEFVTQAILKPSCGVAECHSALKAQKGDVFDSVAGARTTFTVTHPDLVVTCEQLVPPQTSPCNDAVTKSYLYTVISSQDIEGDRMPLDQALSNKDQELIETWISEGARGLYP
ncbi:MAG TPA: hypothetical protein VFQ65_12215 [Kofleriaceae bacterium]|nr:hypothetical protein [Kofleriaceae bacterium]